MSQSRVCLVLSEVLIMPSQWGATTWCCLRPNNRCVRSFLANEGWPHDVNRSECLGIGRVYRFSSLLNKGVFCWPFSDSPCLCHWHLAFSPPPPREPLGPSYMYRMCVSLHLCTGGLSCVSAHGGQRLLSGVFLYLLSTLFFVTLSFTEPEVHCFG